LSRRPRRAARYADKAADRAEHRPCGRHAVSAASDGGPARGSVPILGRVGRYHHRRLCGAAPLRRGREECGSCRGVELLRHRRSRSRDLLRSNLFGWRGAAALLLSTGLAGHAESALVVHSHGFGAVLSNHTRHHLGATAPAERPYGRDKPGLCAVRAGRVSNTENEERRKHWPARFLSIYLSRTSTDRRRSLRSSAIRSIANSLTQQRPAWSSQMTST